MTLLEFALIIIAIVLVVKVFLFLKRRLSLLFSMLKLKKVDTVSVQITNFWALFSKRVTKKPFAKVSVRDKTYAVRLFNGKGFSHSAHIVNESYAVIYMKMGGEAKVKRFVRTLTVVQEASRVYFPRTVFLPELPNGNEETSILLFSPSPRELTYVTEERTSIKAAFTGDEIFGHKVFTKRTFENFIDRDSRGFYDDIAADIYSYDNK